MSRILRRASAVITALAVVVPAFAGCTQTANVSDLVMALDGNGDRKRVTFYTDTKEIHCVATLGIGREGVTIEGLVRQTQRADLTPVNVVVAYAEGTMSPAEGTQKFDISLTPVDASGADAGADSGDSSGASNNVPYPVGYFQCEVYLDGELKRTALFNIEYPPCPVTFIASGTVCAGYYEINKKCPIAGNGLSAVDPAICNTAVCCTCETSGWSCPQ
ncbi:MAG: hypothetical protein FWD69_16180 [Polyangiaceae bacterium]|nr:hypothetical protein [Polyangiaceae bacterium]